MGAAEAVKQEEGKTPNIAAAVDGGGGRRRRLDWPSQGSCEQRGWPAAADADAAAAASSWESLRQHRQKAAGGILASQHLEAGRDHRRWEQRGLQANQTCLEPIAPICISSGQEITCLIPKDLLL